MKRLVSLSLLLLVTVCGARERGLPAQEGIPNFAKINDQLYRGAQPKPAAITNLHRLGVKSIICLRSPGKEWKQELEIARGLGVVCTNIPLHGTRRPTDQQTAQILHAIETMPAPVFVHCEFGCERTGTIIACYRIQHDKWTSTEALKEANKHGMSKLVPGMRRYIVEFEKWCRKSWPAP